ncbi:unnamed protein product [Caenorhabditis brenneri]
MVNSKNYKHWDFPIVRRAPFTLPGTISIKIDVRKEGFEMYISNWRVLYDHRMDKTFAQTVTFLGDVFVRECFLNRYSGLKKSFANEINDQSESSVSKEESSSENKAEDEYYDDEENDSEELDSNEDDE